MNKNDKKTVFLSTDKRTININKILHKKLDKFIRVIEERMNQISHIKKDTNYKICGNDIVETNKCKMMLIAENVFCNNNERIYDYIRMNVDHCINISQILCSHINNIKHENVYNKQFREVQIISNIKSLDIKLFMLYNLTIYLSNSINGLNNIKINKYYDILIFDIKKIVITYIINNLKILFSHMDIYIKKDELYDTLFKIQNNVLYNVNVDLINT